MSEMYTKHAVKYAEVVKDNIYNALLERPSTMVLLGDLQGKDVIDMGCGPGEYAQWLLEQSVGRLTCTDISEEMIALVKNKFGSNVHAYCQNLSQGLPLEKDNSADVIVCPLVLHYIENLTPVFESVYRVLKPGGYMVFSTHHPFADFDCSESGNYFSRELVEEEWNTVGSPVKVQFYRRSLTEISEAITNTGLLISKISEGMIDEKAKELSESTYNHLKNNPNFIFFRCEKVRT
ncbi:TPA: methyltransferase domain-containing protein [Vibrio parahaemolyticus]|uniref:class I SAM-dependent methyltransferase n=2 Tax=Vibrio parahaemolyticus TaxID=670 RepID=UPI0003F941EB|nr:class I SAM-dependent methyltransferase [Vibrio parahaemolyticus]EJG0622523.1 class I SAM-dependent methyltransferase [Vibrio parahaemolyticus]EJG0640762.1 class I SAM-dependent methyltransferase [Vibrio parahaemolyticus]EJG0687596.1 class I SAM-dependent methyltransferase [Vibrio parahaemolyticus]EJG0702084.1 class I SAM-dependent methyltransferase [Vibrio parahaemolyticus]EJG0730714.1 class I SAM-dependent methyltransferase [Vibrio parahaemolyticus]